MQDFHGGSGLGPFCVFARGDEDDARSGVDERGDGGLEDEGPCYGGERIVDDEVGVFDGGRGSLLRRRFLGGSHSWRV